MGKTITEKIFDSRRADEPFLGTQVLRLDRVLCHEITTPIAIADLVARGKDRVFDKNKIKAVIDHVTPSKDSKSATQAKMLRDWAGRNDIRDFFDIGYNGVCHALFPEKGYIRPGYTVIMGDSHTCTHGAFGAFAAGVGTTDLEVGILKGVCAFRLPQTIQIAITGALAKGVFAKDVVLEVIRVLTVSGATDRVIEFHGNAVSAMTMDERMTLCNMAVEAGATSGICMPDMQTVEYLWPFVKNEYKGGKKAALADFTKWSSDPDAVYEKTVTVDASAVEPLSTVGYKPDQVRKIKELSDVNIDQVYIGSCTNGRISDLREAARIAKRKPLAKGVRGILAPATPEVFKTAM
jgi:3-isopropylmalate/(R)-2-methylmalate dehydratase large subunit